MRINLTNVAELFLMIYSDSFYDLKTRNEAVSKLTNCKDCGHQISKNASNCPNCGAKVKRTSIIVWIFAAIIGFTILLPLIGGALDSSDPAIADNSSVNEIGNVQPNEATGTTANPNWAYEESVDDMRGTTTYTAISNSKNNVNLEFPYTGGTYLNLIVRYNDESKNEVLIVTNNGQLWCEYNSCEMTVKFDDKKVKPYSIVRASGGSSEAMFLNSSQDAFINQLKESKSMMIEIGFFNNGNQQFTFDTAGLDWQH